MTFDLIQLFDHPLKFRHCIPATIVTFGGGSVGQSRIQVYWRKEEQDELNADELILKWDINTIQSLFAEVEEEVTILKTRDEDRESRLELAAVVIAVAVLTNIEPETRFTFRLAPGQRHDYCLNETMDEMIEIAGRWEAGLPSLFEIKKEQSELNLLSRVRWVSVTIFHTTPRNRTERLKA